MKSSDTNKKTRPFSASTKDKTRISWLYDELSFSALKALPKYIYGPSKCNTFLSFVLVIKFELIIEGSH